jgi:hypothetical protein
MKLYDNKISVSNSPDILESVIDASTLFLDIETTCLSPKKDFIYCIGCSFTDSDSICIRLFFAEQESDEKEVLTEFANLLSNYTRVITFNGTTFDIPFLQKRYAHHQMADPFVNLTFLDLYKEARRLKNLLQLPNYRQKSIEQFLGCDREDTYSGGELIQIYHNYTKRPDDETLQLLLLHNYEDVKGMYDLCGLLSYRVFLDGGFQTKEIHFERMHDRWYLNCILIPKVPFPQIVNRRFKYATLLLEGKRALLQFPVQYGELRHYFPDYKNYYYLPDEDTLIHKSLGSYVDASHRERATKENCFVKKNCAFISIPFKSTDCYLRRDYNDPDTYLDLTPVMNKAEEDSIVSDEHFDYITDFILLFLKSIIE